MPQKTKTNNGYLALNIGLQTSDGKVKSNDHKHLQRALSQRLLSHNYRKINWPFPPRETDSKKLCIEDILKNFVIYN